MKATKVIVKNYVRHMLGTNSAWALKGLTEIYARQTANEQSSGFTSEDNGIGFSGCDAEILSSFAVRYQQWGDLSDKQMALLFKKMPRYAGQIITLIHADKLETVHANAVKYAEAQTPTLPGLALEK